MKIGRTIIRTCTMPVFLALILASYFALSSPSQSEDSHTPLEPIDCPGERADGENAVCFILHVPADWGDLSNRSLELPVMRFAPLGEKATKPPLLILAGGPGQSVVRLEKHIVKNLAVFRQDRELILMDQRGTGPFASHLSCEKAIGEDQKISLDAVQTCIERIDEDNVHLADYSTAFAAQDYRALRYALKIDQWAIFASSYGARVGQELVKVDEKGIERIVFNGPLFIGSSFFDWNPFPLIEAAIELCNDTQACRQDYPNLFWDFKQIPFDIGRVKLPDDKMPAGLHTLIYRKRLQAFLSRHQIGEIPADITKTVISLQKALKTNTVWTPPSNLPQSMRGISLLMHFAVLCAEEVQPLKDRELDNFDQPLRLSFYRAACEKLLTNANHVIKLDKEWRKAKSTKKPVLIFNGAYDATVNPDISEETFELYPNARHIQVPFAGHDILSKITCARETLAGFMDGETPSELHNRCEAATDVSFKRPE